MIRKILIAGLLTFAAHHLQAQSAPPHSHHMTGVWEGRFTSNHVPDGPLKITVAIDSLVTATMEFGADIKVPPSAFKSITHEGTRVTWTQELLGTPCEGTGTVEGEKFSGEIRCGAAVINFAVRKKTP